MKFIALIPFKNESRFLPTCLSSISGIVDQIICIDDGSTDNSKEIAKKFGCDVYDNSQIKEFGWAEHHIRQSLLQLGRDNGGTHFLCIDADEALTSQFSNIYREALPQIPKGHSLRMQWLALWKSQYHYRDDKSVWSNNFKDFIFADDEISSYDYEFMHVKRTPVKNNNLAIKPEFGAILHYQFSDWESFNIKQADYRCSELINNPKNSQAINNTYSITFENEDVVLKEIPKEWIQKIIQPNLQENYIDWRFNRVIEFFDKFGVEFFEPLNIWHIQQFRNEFIRRTGRTPRQ